MLRITFTTANAAFEGNPGVETCRILRDIIGRIENEGDFGDMDGKVYDRNGNRIGEWSLAEETTEV